jgi:hypothetical protein
VKTFTIATDCVGPRRWCRVRIHPTVEELRVHAQRLNPRVAVDTTGGGWDECFGCFQPPPRFMVGDPGWAPNGYAGTLRLADGHITSEIVAHELVHAAAQVYRMNVAGHINLGPSCRRREEDLAYIYGELYASFEDQWHADE